jgi:hypothetical protein
MRKDAKKIASNITEVLATAITHIPSSKKLTKAIHKSAKKLAKKLIKMKGNVIQSTPIIIKKVIASTNHKAATHKVVVAK